MATLFVSEFTGPGFVGTIESNNPGPSLVDQAIALSGASAPSAPFSARTRMITFSSDGIFCFAIGPAGQVATTANQRVVAGQVVTRDVPPGYVIAGISTV